MSYECLEQNYEKVIGLIKMIDDSIIKRALEIAKKEKMEITEDNVLTFVQTALAYEDKMIKNLINTSKGQIILKTIRNNMAHRVYENLRIKEMKVQMIKKLILKERKIMDNESRIKQLEDLIINLTDRNLRTWYEIKSITGLNKKDCKEMEKLINEIYEKKIN